MEARIQNEEAMPFMTLDERRKLFEDRLGFELTNENPETERAAKLKNRIIELENSLHAKDPNEFECLNYPLTSCYVY